MYRFIFAVALLALTGCCRNSSETWEDVKTAGRYAQKGVNALWGKDYESRMLASGEEFVGPFDDDFIPLQDADLKNQITDAAIPQPRGIPGQNGFPLLGDFYAAPDHLMALFRSVHFDTDRHVLQDKEELAALKKLAEHLKKTPNLYLVIEGHTDERASASYNVALGMRRANAVRSFLVKNGVDLNRIYTVSKGKEQPIAQGHSVDDWKLNRRSEFKVYQK